MKFVVFLLVITAMVAFSALCQEVIDSQVTDTNLATNSRDSVKPADVGGHTRSIKKQGRACACTGKGKAQRGCQCKMQSLLNSLSNKQRVLCRKRGIVNYKQCKDLKPVTKKEGSKHIIIPI